MYSIFSTKIKRHNHLEEGEPPPKKLVTEEDILIKKLSENQLKTSISLTEQLSKKKQFTSSESFSNITSYVSGKTNLEDFQTCIADVDELNNLKSKGLSNKDVELYKDYKNLGPEFWVKYKNVNEDVLYKHINEIKAVIATVDNCDDSDFDLITDNQNINSSSSKEGTSITKFLKLTAQNVPKKEYLPGPMDELPNLEKQFMDNIEDYSSCDIKKIRKKARSMGNKIRNLEINKDLIKSDKPKQTEVKKKNFQKSSKWDLKEIPAQYQKEVKIIDKDKVYGCKPENFYTIKEGQIIKLDKNKGLPTNAQNDIEKSKLTIEEIKNIPKFMNYNPGIRSRVLFLKNLGKNVTEKCLNNLLKQFDERCYSLKVMSGKMRGQAFIEFQDMVQATEALEILNGVVLDRKPIIVQYGKKNT